MARFASQFEVPNNLDEVPDNLSIEDQWIISEFQSTMAEVENSWSNLDIYSATQALKSFGTGVLPSHYLEMVKSRLYDEDKVAAWTLHRIVRDFMSVFSPICPFFTHHISTTIYGSSAVDVYSFPDYIVTELGPNTDQGDELRSLSTDLQTFNSEVWTTKKENGISLNQPITGIEIPEKIQNFSKVFSRMHKLE